MYEHSRKKSTYKYRHRGAASFFTMVSSSNAPSDDDSALDESEQLNLPLDVALRQQRIQAWHPVLDPVWVIFALFYLGVIFVPTGYKIDALEKDVVEMKTTYDDYQDPAPICGINTTYNANRVCSLVFQATEDMRPPVLVYYELTNFHQNHRNYFQSRDDFQLLGKVGDQTSIQKELCDPLNQMGNMTLNPCGLIANTFFNDYFTLTEGLDSTGERLEMIEKGIAWTSDIEYMYQQPDGFNFSECPVDQCDETCCEGTDSSCDTPYYDAAADKCYKYFYPLDDETRYLHETYPDIISPIEGVTNEHFIVWMRVATQPSFRKLYGWINQPISKGENLTFQVNANYVVTRFRGTKSLILTTNNIFGGRNPYFGPSFYYLGYFCFAAGAFFAVKHLFRPRKLADPAYLQYKED